jgi:Ca2+-binding RTX toxin-like protein
MLNIQFFQSIDDLFELAFYDPIDDEFDVDLQNWSSTEINVVNPITGWTTSITGSGFSNPEVTLTGVLNTLEIRDQNGDLVASFSNANWTLAAFINAMDELLINDNEGPFNNLLNLQPINVDASASTGAIEGYLDGVTVPVTATGSDFNDTLVGGDGNDTLLGGDGSDEIRGGNGNDSINPGDNTDFDYILTGAGNDTVNLGDIQVGFVEIDHRDLNAGITATINGNTNTGTINKGANGTTTILDVAGAMFSDGFLLTGSNHNDTFNVTVANGGWMSLRGLDGVDNYVINPSSGNVRIDFRSNSVQNGVNVNLATGVIANDGFGNTETISGNGSVWEIRGTHLNDTMTGSNGNESFIGLAGNDNINGGGGFDRLRFDSGANVTSLFVDMQNGTASGFANGVALNTTFTGIEHIRGTRNGDNIIGADGGVRIESFQGNDTLAGGNGNDTLEGGTGNDMLNGVAGNDVIRAGIGNDLADGGDGNDALFGDGGFDTMHGGAGDDTVDGGNGADSLYGGAGNDLIIGSDGFDQLFGEAGNDTLQGGNTNDYLFGGDGNDLLLGGLNIGTSTELLDGGAGNDTLRGEGGFDLLRGGDGDDVLDGGNQADNLYGDAGNDTLFGGAGFDRLFGGTGDDVLNGGDGPDGHFGQQGNDTIYGGDGNDRFFGGTGNDLILSGNGNDTIYADSGFDTLNGGAGNDLLFGFFNADTFVFEAGHGNDTIGDFDEFNAGERIDFSGLGTMNNLTQVMNASTQVGNNVVINTGGGNSIQLNGVQLADLDASDFIF